MTTVAVEELREKAREFRAVRRRLAGVQNELIEEILELPFIFDFSAVRKRVDRHDEETVRDLLAMILIQCADSQWIPSDEVAETIRAKIYR